MPTQVNDKGKRKGKERKERKRKEREGKKEKFLRSRTDSFWVVWCSWCVFICLFVSASLQIRGPDIPQGISTC